MLKYRLISPRLQSGRNFGVVYIPDSLTSADVVFWISTHTIGATVTFRSYGYLVNALPDALTNHLAPVHPQAGMQRSDCTLPVLNITIR